MLSSSLNNIPISTVSGVFLTFSLANFVYWQVISASDNLYYMTVCFNKLFGFYKVVYGNLNSEPTSEFLSRFTIQIAENIIYKYTI